MKLLLTVLFTLLCTADDENAKQENLKPKVASANNQVQSALFPVNQSFLAFQCTDAWVT